MRYAFLAAMLLSPVTALAQTSTFTSGDDGWRFGGPFPDNHIANPDDVTGGPANWEEFTQWQRKEVLRKNAIKVDDFPQDFGRAALVDADATRPASAAMVRAA